jgi:putative transposase
MYTWRKLSQEERRRVLSERRIRQRPWHSPPHRFTEGIRCYIVTAACYEHIPHIGRNPSRMDEFYDELRDTCLPYVQRLLAASVLPDHYHIVLETAEAASLLRALGRLHGRTSHRWNGHDQARGRKIWFNMVEREVRSEAHLWASINYVHHNPVKHGYVDRWQDWPWSTAGEFVAAVGRERALEIWAAYPVLDYGRGWDD